MAFLQKLKMTIAYAKRTKYQMHQNSGESLTKVSNTPHAMLFGNFQIIYI